MVFDCALDCAKQTGLLATAFNVCSFPRISIFWMPKFDSAFIHLLQYLPVYGRIYLNKSIRIAPQNAILYEMKRQIGATRNIHYFRGYHALQNKAGWYIPACFVCRNAAHILLLAPQAGRYAAGSRPLGPWLSFPSKTNIKSLLVFTV